jgi:hypothetical protein
LSSGGTFLPTPLKIKKKYFDPLENLKKILPLQKFSFYNPPRKFQLGTPSEIQNFRPPSENLVNRGVWILNGMALAKNATIGPLAGIEPAATE